MEWNAKSPASWDWENLSIFNIKANECYSKSQPAEWDPQINFQSFNFAGFGNSSDPVSDLGLAFSSKSSKCPFTNSLSIGESKTSKFTLQGFEASPKDLRNKQELTSARAAGARPTLETSTCSGEQLLTLKLGKWMCSEDVFAEKNTEDSSLMPLSSEIATKRCKTAICQSKLSPRCQVKGCNLDLSSAKDYHRKHKVCESHSKSPKVIVGGQERRFCQQCSRFHALSEFDENKRSCRKRLSNHNARRRKPQLKADSLHPARLSSLLSEGSQQMRLFSDGVHHIYTRATANSKWKDTCISNCTNTKENLLKPDRAGSKDRQVHSCRNEMSSKIRSITMEYHDSSRLLPSKGTAPEVLNPGLEDYMISTDPDTPQNFQRALSLLSTNSRGPCETKHVSPYNQGQTSKTSMSQSATEHLAVGYWCNEHQSTGSRLNPFHPENDGSNNFQEYQLFKSPYEMGSIQFSEVDP